MLSIHHGPASFANSKNKLWPKVTAVIQQSRCSMQVAKDITFGPFRFDMADECLWRGTQAISLRPKAFAVLKLLLEHPGRLVTTQQVLHLVWPGTFVSDAVLKDSIRQLREALDDDAKSPLYIETAHRRGYRFIGKLSEPLQSIPPSASLPISDVAPKFSAGSSSAVLGRESDLAKLSGWLNRAVAGERQTVFVTGEVGIGKTSIVQAFLDEAASIPGLRVVRGQCLEHYGAGEAYLPILEGFSRLCRSSGGAELLEMLRQHAPAWLAQMPTVAPQQERDSLQSRSIGTPRERMLREMADVIDVLTSESPMLLVLEDLHWSDYSTLDLVSYLARRRDTARLMVIGTYRPVDVIVGDHPLKGVKRELQAHGLCHELPLEYVHEDVVAAYLKSKFASNQFPALFPRMIYRRTEGNPLFMVNLVEYLTDRKVIFEEQGTWKLRVDLAEVEEGVPSNVRELIERQIERVTADERRVLEGASVAGMESSTVAIAAGLDMPHEWVDKQCAELARHQFLSPAWLAQLPDGTVTARYRFNHILYLDVAYRLIPAMRRSQIHQRIADRGVAVYGDRTGEIAAELAMHFEQSRDWPRAVQYLLVAIENAIAHSAHHEAAHLAARGIEMLKFVTESVERDKQEMRLRMMLAVSFMAIKGFASPEAEEVKAGGRELFWRYGPSPELFYMLWTLCLYQQFSGEMLPSLEIAHQLIQLAEDLHDGDLIIQARCALGSVLVLLGRSSEALEQIEKGSATYDAHPKHQCVFTILDNKVMFECFAAAALNILGHTDRSNERLSEGLRVARELGHPQTLVVALHIAAQIHQVRGEAALSYKLAKEATGLAEEYGLELWRTYGIIEMGWAEAELGKVNDGIEQMKRGLELHDSMASKLRLPYFLGLLAEQLSKGGRAEEGLATVSKAICVSDLTGERYLLSELYRIKGELLIQSAERSTVTSHRTDIATLIDRSSAPTNAESCFAEALAIARQQGAKFLEMKIASSMNRLNN
jgi:DNA-binding winged helix-turn-helix (wHTH) protein/tetratricopeptide (TPR) repeat protein